VPPSDNVVPDSKISFLGRTLLVGGALPLLPAERIDHAAPSPAAVPAGATKEYGAYIARIACKGCHGPAFAGGPVEAGDPSWPPASNLTVSGPTKNWNEADFLRLMRTGRRPDSVPVNVAMPWKNAGRMTDEELHAVWTYLRSLPGRPTGATTQSASVNATLTAATAARRQISHFTWLIAQVQNIMSSADTSPDDNLESE
jgi:mono/diheme cytochrome c family protein